MDPFVALMRRYVVDYTNRHDPSVCAEIMEPGYTLRMGPHVVQGRDEAYIPAAAKQFAQFPGLGLTVHEIVTNGERLAMRFSEHGGSARHDGRVAAWTGLGLYRWNGRKLVENLVEQDYLARRRQLDAGVPDPVEPPAPAPWDAAAEPADPAAEAVVRAWIDAGLPAGDVVDDGAALLRNVKSEVDDLFSAGRHVAFRLTCRGRYTGGLDGVAAACVDTEAVVHLVGLVTVAGGRITGGHVVRDRLGLAKRLRRSRLDGDLHARFAALRRDDPVHWSETHRAWLLTRYDDVSAAFQNKAFSNDRVRPVLARRAAAGEPSAADRVLGMLTGWMVVNDPPVHTRLRRLAAGAFKGQRIAAMTEQITAIVDEHIDAFLRGSGPQDLIAEIAYPLPATVIATMLGAPPSDRDLFREWSDELALVAFGTGGAARADRHERALRGLREMDGYFRALLAERRREPGEDMLSALMAPEKNGADQQDALSDDELVALCALLLFAGHETTTNSIANAVWTLLRHPGHLARLRAEPALLNPAVEELLRIEGPITVLNRWVVAPTEVRGRAIAPGERVHLVLAAANRDPEKFADPDVLDLTRGPNPHIAFGKGIHACIGAQLARMETRIAVGRIVERLPGLALVAEPAWKDAIASRAMEALLVRHA